MTRGVCTDLTYDPLPVEVDWTVFLSVLIHLDLDRLAILLALQTDINIYGLGEGKPGRHREERGGEVEKVVSRVEGIEVWI